MTSQVHQGRITWLAYVPTTFFGSVLGISGLGLAWRRAETTFSWPTWPGDLILLIGAVSLFLILFAYGLKSLVYKDALAADIRHPVKGPFLGAMPLAILLQTPAIAPYAADFARAIWVFGATLSLFVNIAIFARWYLRENRLEDMNAVWLIPGVGSFVVAITGAPLGFIEASWFFFAIGLVFWGFLSAVLMYRYIFYPVHADPLVPSYWVPVVPPGLMSMIYPMLTGEPLSDFVRVMYYFALFLTVFNIAIIRIFVRLKFALSWWAYTFPLATLTAATIDYARAADLAGLSYAGQALLIVSTALVGYIFLRTVVDIARGRVLVPDVAPAAQDAAH